MLRKLKALGFSANLSYALGFASVIGSIIVWFTQGGTDAGEAGAAGERFGIFVGLRAPTFMAIGGAALLLVAFWPPKWLASGAEVVDDPETEPQIVT